MHSVRILLFALAVQAGAGCAKRDGAAGGRGLPNAPSTTLAGCARGLYAVLGACVPHKIAAAYCGAMGVPSDGPSGAASNGAACAPRPPCPRGRARELASMDGECLPARDVRAFAGEMGIVATPEDVVVCEGTDVLVVSADLRRLGCIPMVPGPKHLAQRIEQPVDVAAWLRETVGVDEGEGAPPLCDALARQPGALVSSEVQARVQLLLVFPDNDVSSAVADARYLEVPGNLSPTFASLELDHAVGPMIEALRSLGGTASQASVAARVRCRRGAKRPHVEPERPDPP